MSFSIEKIIDALEKDVKSRKRLAELIVIEPDIRLAIINAIIRDVATKEDIEKLRISTKEDIERFNVMTKEEIEKLRAATKDDIEKTRTKLKEGVEKLGASTKEDIEKLRSEFRNEMYQFRNELNQFRSELNQLRSEVHSNFRWIIGLIFGMWTSMMVCLIPILLKMIGMI